MVCSAMNYEPSTMNCLILFRSPAVVTVAVLVIIARVVIIICAAAIVLIIIGTPAVIIILIGMRYRAIFDPVEVDVFLEF